MADVTEIRVAAFRRPAAQTHKPAGPGRGLVSGDAANDAALGHLADLEQDGLRAARGFAASMAIGAILWVVVGVVLWVAVRAQ